MQGLLSAGIQSAQFADLLVRDLDDDNTKRREMGDPSGRQSDEGPERAPDLSCGWAGPGGSRGPRRSPRSILKGPPRRQRPQAVLRS